MDRCFLKFGLTVQEATLLLRCAEMQRITPGKLAAIVGRDKGKVTRVIDRLESSGFSDARNVCARSEVLDSSGDKKRETISPGTGIRF